jgi:hypothetical protein
MHMPKTIHLTGEQANLLVIYITMTTNYRKGEMEACRELGEEKDENGMLRFPNIAANATWWEKANKQLEGIKDIIDNAPCSEDKIFPLLP